MTINTQHPPHNRYETVLEFPKFTLFSALVDGLQRWFWQHNTRRSKVSFDTICEAYLAAEKEFENT